ncbi:MAG: IS4 family transposase, partial [Planctomycetota bacterium]
MPRSLPNGRVSGTSSFGLLVQSFLSGEGLPFAEVLSAERIERVFRKHRCVFGQRGVYTAAVMLWSFLSQVLRDGKEAACQAAVARIISYCQLSGLSVPTADTGDYCRARAKLSAAAIRELSCEGAAELESSAEPAWLWKGRYHAKLIDGFTFTMPDTPENQAKYPQPKSQQPGVGLPIARAVALVSLATACVLDLKVGPYQGKETGESSLLRAMLGSLDKGDIAVMDRYYCSYMLLALLQAQGTHACARKHHLRLGCDFRRGRRLGHWDHLVSWTRPPKPEWMTEELYQQIPQQLTLRELRYTVTESGRRTKTIEIITTLTDAQEYTAEE